MLITKKVKQKWNAKTKKHYIDLGYLYTSMRDEFEIDVKDLTDGSSVEIMIQCDYCGKQYMKSWRNYIAENKKSFIHKDCCNNCKKYKIQEVAERKYGVNSVFKLDDIREKIANTNLEKYGAKNPFSSEIIKERIVKTNIERYGVPVPTKNKEIMEKIKSTCKEKYGVNFFIETQVFSGEKNPKWKGGFKHHRIERASVEYIHWRKSVYARDHYTCQCCSNKSYKGNSVKLNAHHICNWKDYPQKRYDTENGITMCETCHLKFHSIYGKSNNTQEQLIDFLNCYGKKVC